MQNVCTLSTPGLDYCRYFIKRQLLLLLLRTIFQIISSPCILRGVYKYLCFTVSVIYCSIKNHPDTRNFKTTTILLFLIILWVDQAQLIGSCWFYGYSKMVEDAGASKKAGLSWTLAQLAFLSLAASIQSQGLSPAQWPGMQGHTGLLKANAQISMVSLPPLCTRVSHWPA